MVEFGFISACAQLAHVICDRRRLCACVLVCVIPRWWWWWWWQAVWKWKLLCFTWPVSGPHRWVRCFATFKPLLGKMSRSAATQTSSCMLQLLPATVGDSRCWSTLLKPLHTLMRQPAVAQTHRRTQPSPAKTHQQAMFRSKALAAPLNPSPTPIQNAADPRHRGRSCHCCWGPAQPPPHFLAQPAFSRPSPCPSHPFLPPPALQGPPEAPSSVS